MSRVGDEAGLYGPLAHDDSCLFFVTIVDIEAMDRLQTFVSKRGDQAVSHTLAFFFLPFYLEHLIVNVMKQAVVCH